MTMACNTTQEHSGPMIELLTNTSPDHIALRGVKIAAVLAGLGQRVTVEQTFINQQDQAIEAVYTFPLPDGAAVCDFEIVTGERVLTGVIEARERAEQQYEEAQREGHGVFLAEAHRPDVFSIRVGNLKPGQAVTVRLTYVAALVATDRSIRVVFPTTVAPRYVSGAGMDPVAAAVDGDALNPPHVLSVPYGLTFEAQVELGLAIKSIGSASHGVCVEMPHAAAPGDATLQPAGQYRVTLHAGVAQLNRDVVLQIELENEAVASGVLESDCIDGREEFFSAVTFMPTFGEDELAQRGAAEVVFLVDCSGSMSGDSIRQARAALELCLRSLEVGDRFNIVRFGSTHQQFAPEPVVYAQETLQQALAYVAATEADLGGTEIYEPLQQILQTPVRDRVRDVIVLTDGQVSNEPAVVQLAQQHRASSRIFAFGIGRGCSAYLVNGLARASGGAAEFVSDDERIDQKVLRTFSRIASPMVTDVRVDWGTDVVMASDAVPAIFDGDAVCVYGRSAQRPGTVTLHCKLGETDKSWQVPLRAAPATQMAMRNRHGVAALLWARQRIQRLEEARGDKYSHHNANAAEIEQVSQAFGVLSAVTAFIAVEHRSIAERTQGLPALQRVPVMVPQGWHGGVEGLRLEESPLPMMFRRVSILNRCIPESASIDVNRSVSMRVSERDFAASCDFDDDRVFDFKERVCTERTDSGELSDWLRLQAADGWFGDIGAESGSVWIEGGEVDLSAWRSQLRALGVTDARQRDSALVLAILRVYFAAEAASWKRAYAKGIRWLRQQHTAAAAWVEQQSAQR